jgi:hypothetical protein
MTIVLSIKLFPAEEQLLLRFEVPLNERTVLAASHNVLVARRPLQTRYCLLVPLEERLVALNLVVVVPLTIAAETVSQLVKQLVFVLQSLHLQSLGHHIVVILHHA